jgi:hypothetical protein
MLIKVLKGFARVWFVLSGLFIVGNLILVWYFEGLSKVQEILSPFNVVNFIAVLITLAPGISAHMLAERLEAKKR